MTTMSSLPSIMADGLLSLLALIVFACATGVGLLSLLRFPDDRQNRLLIAPVAATMLWAITGGLLVRMGWTMADASLPMWGGSIVLALAGAWAMLRHPPSAIDGRMLAVSAGIVAATLVSMAAAIGRGLFSDLGPGNPDTFLYTTLAAAFWEHGLSDQGRSFFFQQLGDGYLGLGAFRNHTFVLLAFFSRLVEAGEPTFVRNLFMCWSVFAIGMSAAYYRRVSRRDLSGAAGLTVLYAWLVIGLGWAFVPGAVGNWDNALFVSVVPILAGLSYEPGGWRFSVALGVTGAYAFLTYPELAPIAGIIVSPYFVLRLWTEPRTRLMVLQYALAAIVALVLIAPAASSLWYYFIYQMKAAGGEMRPGGGFAAGLLLWWWNPSVWWGLGPEHGVASDWRDVTLALLLTALTVPGVARALGSRRAPQGWAFLILVALAAYFLAIARYPYGVYKILSVTWWLVAALLLDGMLTLWRTRTAQGFLHPFVSRAAVGAAALVVVLLASVLTASQRSAIFFPPILGAMPTPDELLELRDRARRQPPGDVLVMGRLATASSTPWVLYALRSTPLRVYLPERPRPPLSDSFFWTKTGAPDAVLLEPDERVVAGPALIDTPRFRLVGFRGAAMVTSVENANGLEAWGTWLGATPITISILSQQPLAARMEFEAEPGPSRPESTERTLIVVEGDREVARTRVAKRQLVSLPVMLSSGTTRLTLRCEEAPTVASMPNGDTRALLVAIRGLSVRPAAAAP